MRKRNRYTVAAVDRALELLVTVAAHPGCGASQLASKLGANRSLVFRMLATLADRGFVLRDSSGGYRLGPQLLYLGQNAASADALVSVSAGVLDRLHSETEESVFIVVRDGFEMLCVAERKSTQPVRVAAGVGVRGGLHSGGAAKVLLAYAPREMQEKVIQRELRRFVPSTLRTRKAVHGVLQKIRQQGYYEAIDEVSRGVASVSAPIRDRAEDAIAVLAVVGPTERIEAQIATGLTDRVVAAAAEISAGVTWRAPAAGH